MDRMQMAHGLLQKRKRNYASIRATPDGGVGGKAERAEVEVKEVGAVGGGGICLLVPPGACFNVSFSPPHSLLAAFNAACCFTPIVV
jgi:hypothetical protein